jgi:ABC-type amino acid transport substrate-binding protein
MARARRVEARAGALLSLLLLAGTLSVHADLPEIQKRQTLRVLAVLVENETEFVSSDTTHPGFDRDLLEGFAKLHGLRTELVPTTAWDRLIPALKRGEGDVIAGRFTVTDARRQQIAFTSEVFPTRVVAVTRAPREPVRTLADLRTLKIGLVRGTSLVDALLDAGIPAANLDESLASGRQIEALVSGRAACTVLELADAVAAQQRDPSLHLGAFVGPPGSYAYGVRREDTQLRAALDAYITSLRRTPGWSRLVVRYFGSAAPEVLKAAGH